MTLHGGGTMNHRPLYRAGLVSAIVATGTNIGTNYESGASIFSIFTGPPNTSSNRILN
jgi:hypothetical protein